MEDQEPVSLFKLLKNYLSKPISTNKPKRFILEPETLINKTYREENAIKMKDGRLVASKNGSPK